MDNTKDVLKGAGRRRNRENVEEMCKKCRPSEPEVKEAEGREMKYEVYFDD